jgi:hypothetical protein
VVELIVLDLTVRNRDLPRELQVSKEMAVESDFFPRTRLPELVFSILPESKTRKVE